MNGKNGHLMVSKRSRVTLRTGVKPSPPVRGTHQLQTPYVRMGLVPNSLELFQVRWACTEARLAVLIRRVRIPLAMRACLKEVQGRPAGNPSNDTVFQRFSWFPVQKWMVVVICEEDFGIRTRQDSWLFVRKWQQWSRMNTMDFGV